MVTIVLVSSVSIATAAYTRRDFAVDYLFKYYDKEDAAFRLKNEEAPSIKATYYGITILHKLLNEKEFKKKINETILSNWIKSKQVSNINATDFGAFRDTNEEFGTIYTTLFAIKTLSIINKIDEINRTNLVNWLNSCYNEDGSFSIKPTGGVSLSTTYAAVIILSELGELNTIVNKTKTVNWILKLQINNATNSDYGAFSMYPNATIGSVVATFMAIDALNILGASDSVNLTRVKTWVEGIYSSKGYFFDNKEDMERNEYNIYTTYYGILVLKTLNGLTDEKKQQITKWILDLQRSNGGFAFNEKLEDCNLLSTALALLSLYELSSLDVLNVKAPWIWGGYTFLEVLVFAILAIIIISDN